MAFSEPSEHYRSAQAHLAEQMPEMMDMADCHGETSQSSIDSYCMDHCASLLALVFHIHHFAAEIPFRPIQDPLLVLPLTDPTQLWRPPTQYS